MPQNEIRELVFWAHDTIDFNLQSGPESEEKFIKGFYVAEKEGNCVHNLHAINTLEDALKYYFSLAADKGKVFGIQSVRGVLDFVECIDGHDKFIDDYKKLSSWNMSDEVIKIADSVKRILVGRMTDMFNQREEIQVEMEP